MRKKLIAAALVGSAVAVAVSVFAGTAGAAPTSPPAGRLALLAQPERAQDALPDFVPAAQLADDGLVINSTRLLGQAKGARHWAARDTAGNVCLVTTLGSTPAEQVTGMTCASPKDFDAKGLTLQVARLTDATEAHLLPDGYTAAAQASPQLTVISPNLAISDATDGSTAPIPLAPGNGATSELKIPNLSAAGS
ncbi:MAG TPA: hypothetical protein VFV66_24770 [Nonomuraea sp.]|nr:hypothetical protein [Nonomuraea sp.]